MLNAPSITVMTLILTELTLFFHDIATRTETFSGPLKVTTWTTGLASIHPTRDQSLTFGSGSKDWPLSPMVAIVLMHLAHHRALKSLGLCPPQAWNLRGPVIKPLLPSRLVVARVKGMTSMILNWS